MDRWLYMRRHVAGAPAEVKQVLRTRLSRLLTGEEEVRHDGDGSFVMTLHSRFAGRTVSKQVRARLGVAIDLPHGGVKIPLSWEAAPIREAFPTFDGAVEYVPLSDRHGELSLVGRYRPPLGPLGAAGDALGLRQQAFRVADDLVTRVADRLATPPEEGPPAAALSVTGAMTVRDVMTPDPVVLDPDMPLRTAALLLFHMDISGVPVVAANGELIGVLSEADLLEKQASPPFGWRRDAGRAWERRDAVTVGQACTRPAKVTHVDASLHDAARKMLDERIARLVVLEDAELVGIVSRHDILRALLRTDGELQAIVDEYLERIGEGDVAADVEWGVIKLSGKATLRSRIAEIDAHLRSIDGVIAVDSDDVGWQTDDVILTTPLM